MPYSGVQVPFEAAVRMLQTAKLEVKVARERLKEAPNQEAKGRARLVLKNAENRERDLSRVVVPKGMKDAKCRAFRTTEGLQVEVVPSIRISKSKRPREEMIAWLRSNGHGSVADQIERKGLSASQRLKEDSTVLAEFVRRELGTGKDVPLELFGASVTEIANITYWPPTTRRRKQV